VSRKWRNWYKNEVDEETKTAQCRNLAAEVTQILIVLWAYSFCSTGRTFKGVPVVYFVVSGILYSIVGQTAEHITRESARQE